MRDFNTTVRVSNKRSFQLLKDLAEAERRSIQSVFEQAVMEYHATLIRKYAAQLSPRASP